MTMQWDDDDPAPELSLQIFYFVVASILTSLPIYLYVTMFEMGAQHSGIFVIVTIGSSVIVAFSYHNVASWTEQKLHADAEETRKKKDKDMNRLTREILRQDCCRMISLQSVAFSILYNNALFLFAVCTMGFYVLNGFCAPFNYIMTVAGSATLAFYHSIQM